MTDVLPSVSDPTLGMSSISSLSAKIGPNANIEKTAQDFESMFATQMLQPMFEGIGVDTTFGGGHGEEVMRSFLLQEYGKIIAKGDRLGIASQVRAEMLHAQEAAGGKTSVATRGGKNPYSKAALRSPSSPLLSQGATNVSVQ